MACRYGNPLPTGVVFYPVPKTTVYETAVERILASWVGELAVPIYRGREVTGFAQDDTGVDVELSDGHTRFGRNISSGATEDAA